MDVSIDDRSSAKAARDSAQEYVGNNLDRLRDRDDAVLVVDEDAEYGSSENGYAFGGEKHNKAAGSDDRMTCIVGDHISSGLYLHEVCHLYGGEHYHHDLWGSWEYTVMGNPYDERCSGGSNSYKYKARTREFNQCAVEAIRDYMDYWHSNGEFES